MREAMMRDLTTNILPFWSTKAVDTENGGFYGEILGDGRVIVDAKKGLILNARILWSFATAARVLKNEEYKAMAAYAYNYIIKKFLDPSGGGYYMLNADGTVNDSGKSAYAQGFLLYGLSAYALIEPSAAEVARRQYEYITQTCKRENKYLERFGEKDILSMNTYLHIIEPVTLYYKIEHSERVRAELEELLGVFLDKVYNKEQRHFNQFFDDNWNSLVETNSYGHDIEGSWLLCEAAEALGDREVIERVKKVALDMAEAVYSEGLDPSSGAVYEEGTREEPPKITRNLRVWWAQAEGVVGFYNAYQISGDVKYLNAAERCWKFIESEIIDPSGEWRGNSPNDSGTDDNSNYKVNAWKCPYHNSRAALEIYERMQ